MSGKLSSLGRRLTKVEQQLAERKRRVELANCNCREIGIALAGHPEGFEAEMNLPCPTHGLRRFGQITSIHFVAPESDLEGVEKSRRDNAEIDRLVDIYEVRLAEQDSQKLEKNGDDAEEF